MKTSGQILKKRPSAQISRSLGATHGLLKLTALSDSTSSRAFRIADPTAFAEAGITHNGVGDMMIYDAFARLPIYGLEDLLP